MLLCLLMVVVMMVSIDGYSVNQRVGRRMTSSLSLKDSNVPYTPKEKILSDAKHMISAGTIVASLLTFKPSKAYAFGSLEDANNKLNSYGLPPILFVPPNFLPLVSEFGRGSIKEEMVNPVVVQFAYPNTWVVARTSVNNNGEAGTISANDYIKGDSAFFFTRKSDTSGDSNLSVDDKGKIADFLLKSLSQKGDPVESFKVVNVRNGYKDKSGQQYLIADISYALNTEAGFLVSRKGVVGLSSVGGYTQCLVCVSTDKRWKGGMESKCRDIADSFRVYKLNSGIFSATTTEESST